MSGGDLGVDCSIILFISISILLSLIVHEIKKLIKLPVSPMLLLAGVLLRTAGSYIGDLKTSVELVDSIQHTTVLFIFMPVLIFETCFATDWYTFKREIWQILPLATTAVLLSAYLTAEMFIYILGYDLTLAEAMLIGTMLSATDHVAVVAQLKEIKASQKFELLIQGETLLNEGTVMVLIFVFLSEADNDGSSTESAIGLFCRLSLGGIALGLVFAVALCFWLSKVENDSVQETTLTIVTAYLLFYISEATSLHVSGAYAIVAYGLFMSAWGKTVISPSVEHDVHSFWNILASNVESLVFVIGGMLLGMLMMTDTQLSRNDIGKMFACFLMMHVIRAIVIIVHFPVLKYFGYGLTFREACVLILAGLKGAIAITLALLVYRSDEIDKDVRNLALFMTISISTLSIFFDSLAIRYSVKYLGLEKLTTIQENMMVVVTNSLIEETTHKLQSIRIRDDMKLADWEDVIKIAGAKNLLAKVFKTTNKGRKIIEQEPDSPIPYLLDKFKSSIELSSIEIVNEIRSRYLSSLKGIYWHLFEKSQCRGKTALALIETANRALDEYTQPMKDWRFTERNLLPKFMVNLYVKGASMPIVGFYFRKKLYECMSGAYDIASTFIHGHHEAEELIDYMGIDDVDKGIFEEVMHEVHENIHQAEKFIKISITDNYPEVLRYIQTKKAFSTLVNSQRKLIYTIFKQGVIGEIEHDYLLDSINQESHCLSIDKYTRLPTLKELLYNNFPEASEDQLEILLSNCQEVTYEPGQIIYNLGEISLGAYIIIKGRVREYSDGYTKDHVLGTFIGMKHLLGDYDTYFNNLEAVTSVVAYKLNSTVLQHVPELEMSIWKMCVYKILILLKDEIPELNKIEYEKLNGLISKCSLKMYVQRDTLYAENGGVLLYGEIDHLHGPRYVPPEIIKYNSITEKVIFMHFPNGLGERLRVLKEPLNVAIFGFLRSNDSRFKLKGNAVKASLEELARSLPKVSLNLETNGTSFDGLKLYEVDNTHMN